MSVIIDDGVEVRRKNAGRLRCVRRAQVGRDDRVFMWYNFIRHRAMRKGRFEGLDGKTSLEGRTPLVGLIMGSRSDWETMQKAAEILDELDIPYETRIVSAHRTPDEMFRYAETAESRGLRVIIAGAGGAAHLPGMVAAKTVLPVIGVPMPTKALGGLDSLLSIVQMPSGVPVATVAIGAAGAANAALLAAEILGIADERLRKALRLRREAVRDSVLAAADPKRSEQV